MQRWWSRLLEAMTGGRCHRRRKMMGRGADGGCGTEEKPCPISRVPTKFPAKEPASVERGTQTTSGIDFYTQARKALSERSPFDSEEAQVSTVPTLPSRLANLLSRHSDGHGRKRQKKSHTGEEKSSRTGGMEKGRGSNFWVETEDYFRELTIEDIDRLHKLSSVGFSASQKFLSIPSPGYLFRDNVNNGNVSNEVNAGGAGSDDEVVVKEEVKEEFPEVDSAGIEVLRQDEKSFSSSLEMASCSGLEWLLGSRNKIYLTSERPSKKRKLLGGDAGLEKLLVAHPVDGFSSLCHYCSLGDKGNQSNRLMVCSSCNVAVHERCYGLHDDVVSPWTCSWCRQGNAVHNSDKPCLLCPKQGGALKAVCGRGRSETANGGSAEFAHLFCCQWMPEVFIQDTRTMEPVMNIDGIKETRRKLICNLCKVKYGACVRCSNGTCRTSFHPICAREAGHRMEIWAKFGCDDVELRAFCSKHSDIQQGGRLHQSGETSITFSSDSRNVKDGSAIPMVHKPHKLKIGRKNGDKMSVYIEAADTSASKLGNGMLHEEGLSDTLSHSKLQSDCGHKQQPASAETFDRNGDDNASDFHNFSVTLKKLIDRGQISVEDIASDLGVSPDSLASMLNNDCLASDLHCQIATWLTNHAHTGTSQKNLKVKIKSALASKDDMRAAEDSDAVIVSESDITDVVPVKSVPPRRRTKNNIRILKDNKVICSSKQMLSDDGILVNEAKRGQPNDEDTGHPSKETISDVTKKNFMDPGGVYGALASSPAECEGGQSHSVVISELTMTPNLAPENNTVTVDVPGLIKAEDVSTSFVHPLIRNKIMNMQNVLPLSDANYEFDGLREISLVEASSGSGISSNQHVECINSDDMLPELGGAKIEELVKARKMGLPEMSPEDEVEGELIFHQHRLLDSMVARKRLSDNLIHKIVKSLPLEIDSVSNRKWDAVIVSQYLSKLREAKKQGRKERRHKEAQAVLAAATAAAAASSRMSSFRKDALDESARQEGLLKANTSTGRDGIYSQQMPCVKETLSKLAVSWVSSDTKPDSVQSKSDFSKEHSRICDICRRSETVLNPILLCSSCKVAVHLDCYRSVKDSTGPWYCEVCEDLLSRSSSASAVNLWEKSSLVAECGVCGGNTGAFRKSVDGQWVHAFCAEWVLESTFRRGQVNPIEGMDSVLKGTDICHICHRKEGVCIKCNYGHCQSTFHPTCARNAGFFMNIKTDGGKLQHKGYCEKHSLEQRAKVETQRRGPEELKNLKQIRVELERLRLLCERIVKREKLKRELVLCSQDMLVSNRDSAALSALIRSPFFQPDVSSESATTSLKGNTDDCRSGSEAIQKSDDVTVDSTVSGKRRIRFSVSMDNDQKTDDSSTSQLFLQKPRERVSFSGKQIPHRPSFVASLNLPDDTEKRSKSRKHRETFEKELLMTSDQASMKNQRLPKGFIYVTLESLSKGEATDADAFSGKSLECGR
ncbi:hypothetical protein NMG60_11017460 [Bertholletia excelsa]